MNLTNKRAAWFSTGMLWAMLVGLPAIADDTELFVGNNNTSLQGQPNILFILDDSGSMDTDITTRVPFDSGTPYTGTCTTARTYYKSGSQTDNPPDCNTNQWFDTTALTCAGASTAFDGPGFFFDTVAQFDDSADIAWEGINQSEKSRFIECESDSGAHGDGTNSTRVYAQDGVVQDPWSDQAANAIAWSNQQDYVLYSGNYVNWWYNGPTTTQTRLQVMQQVSNDLLDAINGVNVGMMHFNNEFGGLVEHPIEDIATSRQSMKDSINALTASGWTPLTESLYEAALYFMGRSVDQGTASDAGARTVANSNIYESPLDLSCQRNFAIMLTDGVPTRDSDRDSNITSMSDAASQSFNTLVGPSCDGDGSCLDDLAEFLFDGDLSSLPGQQNLSTYTVGFDIDLPILQQTATRGGGEYRTANDAASLTAVLTDFVLNILDTQTTFSAPAVSINSFNRTRNLNDLFISVFSPAAKAHWAGNLKKYRLRVSDNEIIDADGDAAVDPTTGFFANGSRSFWATGDDPDVQQGGAANRIPAPVSRKVYTHLTGNTNDLTHVSNQVTGSNAAIDDALLNSGQAGGPTRNQVIDFIRGVTPNSTTARNQMGDPLHSQPVSLVYDGLDPDGSTVFFATNDGYLHAINARTGVEQWSFVPEEFLDDQVLLFDDESTSVKHYGIDGSLRLQTLANNDGVIDPNTEKVYLIFGMRRGGNFYYALDVTDPANPSLLWRRGSAELIGNGQSWANPVPARINMNSVPAQSSDHLVLVLAGGYDPTQDGFDNVADNNGNAIYIVDTVTGSVLWHGSENGGDKAFPQMNSSFPAEIRVVDLNTDGFADRMYASDVGGQVWRFDIFNGATTANLVTGGVIAQLGAAPLPTAPVAAVTDGPDNRRFFYAPDIALISQDDFSFIHIGIGSGYRAHPNSTANQDRFYALRDYATFRKLSDADYAAITPVTDADLVDVTTNVNAVVLPGSPGWRFELRDGGWIGEKVLAEARTFNNQVFFTSFIPNSGGNLIDPCTPAPATNRLYVMNLFNGAPVTNMDGDATENEPEDRFREFPGTITSEVVFIFPSPDDPTNCVADQCTPPPVACVDLFCFPTNFGNNPIRTFWSQESIE